jgi:RNA polymerase sigma-70 factor, ECF subfamily
LVLTESDADIELLEAWRNGDRRAGDHLFRSYYPQVLGYFRLRAPEVAEDLTQRTFLACTEGKAPVSSFRGYLFGTARHVFSHHTRSAGRRARQASLPLPKVQSSLTPSSLVALRQEHFLLLQALHQLKREQQEVLALHYVHSLRAREIAEAMEIPVSTVTTRLARARDALRKEVMSLDAPQPVRGALADDLETWTRSLGPIVHEETAPPKAG